MPEYELGPVIAAAIIALIIVRNALFLNPSPQRKRKGDRKAPK